MSLRLVAIFAAVVALVAFASWRGQNQTPQGIEWKQQIEPAVDGRMRLVYFTADWCPPCRKMKAEVWPAEEVQKALESYDVSWIDFDENRELANAFGVTGVPSIYILNPEDEIVDLQHSMSASSMVSFLEKHQ
jgi:thiol:disulfide interchange protein